MMRLLERERIACLELQHGGCAQCGQPDPVNAAEGWVWAWRPTVAALADPKLAVDVVMTCSQPCAEQWVAEHGA